MINMKIFLLVCSLCIAICSAFYTQSAPSVKAGVSMGALSASLARRRQFTLQMGLGDIFKKALANDPSLPPATNPGLSGKEDKAVEVEFLPAKKTVKAYPGQKLSLLATAAKVNINYQCQKGECGTCTVKFNGTPVKTCQASLPINSSTKKYTIVVPKEPPKRRR